ncbi:Uu.00g061590.m01.CDS01 [Anthostomella pinea]|uniref:Uu.00g061590.m01.CDS01 n=1 Tax=Anthostomella pinea TaxID=933095 RepID=A0AAI8VTB6_9PEZI|nr:Uu.00g061590.m01.CDS01 [Anthostomella pinea]
MWFLAMIVFAVLSQAAKHRLIVGTFSTEFLYTLEYDDQDQSLVLVATNPVPAASQWIALNHDKTKLYGTDWNAAEPSFMSYDIQDPLNIKHEATIVGGRYCSGSKSIFVAAYPKAPYTVYSNNYYGDAKCSSVMSVHDNGTLKEIIQDYTYAPGSAVHGLAFSSGGGYLFSADTIGNKIWTHQIDATTGQLTYASNITGPSAGSDPRHIIAHGGDKFLYTVLEGSSEVAQYVMNRDGQLFYHDTKYPLIRESENPADFWADEISMSVNSKYLWATNRARDNTKKGYISVLELDEAEGAIAGQNFLLPTSTSGGFANAVAASPFDESLAALTDNSTGFVEIWNVNGYPIAHLNIEDGGGCCANAVWLD